jgi:hypothetical protein
MASFVVPRGTSRVRFITGAIALAVALVALTSAGAEVASAGAEARGLSSCPQNKYPGFKVDGISCKKAYNQDQENSEKSCLDVGEIGKCSFKANGWKCTERGKSIPMAVELTRNCTKDDQEYQNKFTFTG